MASSATDSQGKDKTIREQLVDTGDVDVMLSVGNNFFYTKSLPCTLWFFDKGKREENKDKVLFIDARNYYTVVDRTLNEWSQWQMKNLNAIVWLYRGEIDKYRKLCKEYERAIWGAVKAIPQTGEDLAELLDEGSRGHFTGNMPRVDENSELDFIKKRLDWQIEVTKKSVACAKEELRIRSKKLIDSKAEEFISAINDIKVIISEYEWLTEKFGDGEYKDILGLCKCATKKDIEEKGYSLTPGAYVGVTPVEDDGVDFHERMKEIHSELLTLQAESNTLMETISKNMKEMGL